MVHHLLHLDHLNLGGRESLFREKLFYQHPESREEDEVSGFFVLSHLWMRGYFRLG